MTDRPDLAAMIVPLGRALVDAELPVPRERDLSMWACSVLLALDERPLRTQAAPEEVWTREGRRGRYPTSVWVPMTASSASRSSSWVPGSAV
ncbi:hypothetical protein [Streptosporangium lutulentum]|uniref:Uncharacterized protein n=1 Tax=Streptosporangium lutulentum TaxID=1461250 RepID=A0ABT9QMH4_9ACTN|nr:hypothetical protein [Streptosporangium lutulentum]MDP9847249.1 hypothetical protein [Streptosporangium lutulentum]